MNVERRRLCNKICTVLGGFLLLFPNSVVVFWGNISVYVLSYCIVVRDSTYGIEAPWIISTFEMFITFGLLVYKRSRKYLGKRLVLTLGIVILDLGFFCSYLTVQTTFMALNVTLAAMTGFGTGLLQGHAFVLIVDVANNDTGFLLSFATGAFYWGGGLFNFIATYFINPDNNLPATQIGHAKYFTQKNVLDKVPSLFLVFGSVSVGFHLVASLLLNVNTCLALTGNGENAEKNELKSENTGDNEGNYGSNTQVGTPEGSPGDVQELNREGKCLRSVKSENTSTVDWSNGVELTPKEMLLTPSFYALFVTALMAEYPLILLFNYYKSFGQLWIDDDHFLTESGNVMIFTNVWLRLLWGFGMDKIGTKSCFVLNIILLIFISSWFYFTAMVNEWFYAIVVIVNGSLTGAFFSGMVMGVVCLYGKTHFTTNFGILRMSSLILNFVVPFVTEAILNNLGWYYIFASAAFGNVVSLILMLFYIPLK